jgi:FKBP-type peptidyl-prolyl cis-trans isomerase FkpA
VVHVAGWLDRSGAQGKQLFDTHDRGKPVSFLIGTDKVMEGWNEGVVGMLPGGRRLLMIPSELAYGNRQVDDSVPANAKLILIIELLSLEENP